MPDSCLLYYITDRTAFPPDEPNRRRRVLEKIAEAAQAGVDYIQLREKDLPTRELESLALEAVSAIHKARGLAAAKHPQAPALLINSRTDIAIAAGAEGVHLRSHDISPQELRMIWTISHVATAAPGCLAAQSAAVPPDSELSLQRPLIGVSCHSAKEVAKAAADGATFAVFAPVFEKKDRPGTQATGLSQLREACRAPLPVLALGGVTLENARSCLEAGAAGIAAVRLFQENDIGEIVRCLRAKFGRYPS